MAGSSATLHEKSTDLQPATINRHRAIVSLMEELEAIDWYDQRVDATDDESLKAILAHNRDEEMEHAAMTLEWVRRHSPTFDAHLRTYLFTEGSILAIEAKVENGADEPPHGDGSLGIGNLRGKDGL